LKNNISLYRNGGYQIARSLILIHKDSFGSADSLGVTGPFMKMRALEEIRGYATL
jgi:hypothetical protein